MGMDVRVSGRKGEDPLAAVTKYIVTTTMEK
jgi:hypothetical protein